MLKSKIEKMVEEKRIKYGIMGSEGTNIKLILTDAEVKEFHELELTENYIWEIEGNILFISYVE